MRVIRYTHLSAFCLGNILYWGQGECVSNLLLVNIQGYTIYMLGLGLTLDKGNINVCK